MNLNTDIKYRKESLKNYCTSLQNEEEIIKALYNDFKKPAFEAVLTETNYVISDLKETIKNIDSWAKPKSFSFTSFLLRITSIVNLTAMF
jgi:aldehyde dehydrogenase (NAD+)